MRYFLTAVLSLAVGAPFLTDDASAGSRRSYPGNRYRGHLSSKWNRTEPAPRAKRILIPKGRSARKIPGRHGIHYRNERQERILGWPRTGPPRRKNLHQKILGWPKTGPSSRRKHEKRPPALRGHRHEKRLADRPPFRRSRFVYTYAPIYYYPVRAYVPPVGPSLHNYLILGRLVKGEVSGRMGNQDRIQMAENTHAALETVPDGGITQWYNPGSGIAGTVSPLSSFRSDQGAFCRELQQTVTLDGLTEVAYGTACRLADGGWQIASY